VTRDGSIDLSRSGAITLLKYRHGRTGRMIAASQPPGGVRLQHVQLLAVDHDAIDKVRPDLRQFLALEADHLGDQRDRLLGIRLDPGLGLDQRREKRFHLRTVLGEIVLHHHDVEGFGIDAASVEFGDVIRHRLARIGDVRLPGVEGIDAPRSHGRQHFLRPQVDEGDILFLEAGGGEQRCGVDLAAGAGGKCDPLALEIRLALDAGLAGDHRFQV
jgi:hypothetical protein